MVIPAVGMQTKDNRKIKAKLDYTVSSKASLGYLRTLSQKTNKQTKHF
jgi:hypothetical protein